MKKKRWNNSEKAHCWQEMEREGRMKERWSNNEIAPDQSKGGYSKKNTNR
jgi:hypothetical protein